MMPYYFKEWAEAFFDFLLGSAARAQQYVRDRVSRVRDSESISSAGSSADGSRWPAPEPDVETAEPPPPSAEKPPPNPNKGKRRRQFGQLCCLLLALTIF